MARRMIYITDFDKTRIEKLITSAKKTDGRHSANFDALSKELENAHIVRPEDVPPDVVTMNSRVKVRDIETDEVMTWQLTFPGNADADKGAISVLAPVGMAILGYACGDIVEWAVPSGVCRFRIEEILYQPEAAGDYNM